VQSRLAPEQQNVVGLYSSGTHIIWANREPKGIVIIAAVAITILFTLYSFIIIQNAINTKIGGERLITIVLRE
jgi:hypothetical protein